MSSFQRILILPFLLACVGTETGNPYEGDGAFGTESPMGIAPEPILEAGVIGLDAITLTGADVGETGCDTVATIFEGPRVVGLTDPERLTMTLREGTWCEVGLSFTAIGATPTLSVSGSLIDGSSLEVQLWEGVDVQLVATEPFALSEGEGIHLVLDIDRLFATASLGTAPREGGTVVIDETTDPERAAAIAASFPPALRVVRDLNGDGVLDPEERDGPVLATGAE
ncbi:MAG: hypothetical protein JJ863_10760 [Deltaproteobacteria bacterium]|nr:hypothetical protein [Deltaproteobacteria bacterium]